ncbi:MAG: hypothetical protein FD146_1271 [Anaerolineaceae bacterium]|nr:MAG: hypothetical protein FD146_1271 [Anaerolineaceae bacterium]
MRYAFVDESGTVACNADNHFLAIALVSTAQPRTIEVLVRKAHKKYGTSLASGEMKADASSEATIRKFLQKLAAQPVAIVAVIINKQSIVRPPANLEDIYREAVGQAVRHAVSRWPRMEIVLDKRYTARKLRYALEQSIREQIADLHQEVILIHQEDSLARKELQATDYVAWAFFQKYVHGDSRFYDLIAGRVIVEEVVERRVWQKKKAAHPGS